MTASAIRPPRIKRGETLGIVAPAGPVKLERFERGIARLGDAFRLRVAPSVTAPHPSGVPSYLAASDDQRADELMAMIRDPDVRAIVVARGGYGLMRILPKLDPSALAADPKPIVGFSDVTALLAWAYAAGVRGVHGPLIVQLDSLSDRDVASLIDSISEARAPGVRPWPLVAHGSGTRRGPLFAGNLTMIAMLANTPWPVPLAGSLTLIEEVGEKPYEIDRYFTQLVLIGELARVRGVIVGDFMRCSDPNPPTGVADPADAALQTILERCHSARVPVAVGAPVGHGDRNEAIPFGADAILDLDAATLEITEAAVQ
ncbi:MAG TPA: LD-carboxypeptidase [Kofleriaceae bacterium]|jgi:muramoyltetrapeptide carboxypeptidase|nr:LD-carboxypeptidase [Kofleriaceae bacterium]